MKARLSSFRVLKNNRVALSPEERDAVIQAKAVWHHGPNGEQSPAVWKSGKGTRVAYVTNTHRAYQTAPTLKGAIAKFHGFIKSTA